MHKLLLNKNKYVYNISLYQVGYEKCDKNHVFGPVIRDFYILHFIVDGEGCLEHQGKKYKLKKGDIFLIPTNEIVRYYANESNPYEYYWVGFNGVNASEILKQIGFLINNNLICEVTNNYDEILKIFVEMCSKTEENSLKENLMMLGYFYLLMSHLTPSMIKYEPMNVDEAALKVIFRYIEFNYNVDIKMEILERIASMHRSNIYRMFMKYYKVSPFEYILQYRMDKALHLLKNTNESVKKIAYLVGYNDSAYFCKVFKKRFSKTPSNVRKLK